MRRAVPLALLGVLVAGRLCMASLESDQLAALRARLSVQSHVPTEATVSAGGQARHDDISAGGRGEQSSEAAPGAGRAPKLPDAVQSHWQFRSSQSPTGPAPVIAPQYMFGLMNRLRALSHLYIIAADAQREMYVDWHKAPDCGVDFGDLFDTTSTTPWMRLPMFDHRAPGAPRVSVRVNGTIGNITSSVRQIRVEGNCVDSAAILEQLRVNPDEVFVLESSSLSRPLHITCQEFLVRRAAFYRSLQPIPAIQRHVDAFYHEHMMRHLVVGVHVRVDYGDDYPVVPATGDTRRFFFQSAPQRLYETAMEEVAARHPTVKFFISTNSEIVKVVLAQRFPGRVLFVQPTVDIIADFGCDAAKMNDGGRNLLSIRNSKCGMRLALMDWLLLSKSALIIGPYFSSFSEEASTVHLTPRIQLNVDGNLGGFDVNAKYCRYVYDASPSCPEANTSREPMVGYCTQLMEAWGVSNVYCPQV